MYICIRIAGSLYDDPEKFLFPVFTVIKWKLYFLGLRHDTREGQMYIYIHRNENRVHAFVVLPAFVFVSCFLGMRQVKKNGTGEKKSMLKEKRKRQNETSERFSSGILGHPQDFTTLRRAPSFLSFLLVPLTRTPFVPFSLPRPLALSQHDLWIVLHDWPWRFQLLQREFLITNWPAVVPTNFSPLLYYTLFKSDWIHWDELLDRSSSIETFRSVKWIMLGLRNQAGSYYFEIISWSCFWSMWIIKWCDWMNLEPENFEYRALCVFTNFEFELPSLWDRILLLR